MEDSYWNQKNLHKGGFFDIFDFYNPGTKESI